jgi:Fic family protein
MSKVPDTLPLDTVWPCGSLDAVGLEFLHQSNAIEQIYSLNYKRSTAAHLQGHAAAYLNSQSLGKAHKIISHIDLCYWQQLIVLEQAYVHLQIPRKAVGRFRSELTPYNVGVGEYIPPSFMRVPDLMRVWMSDLRAGLLDRVAYPDINYMASFCGGMLQRFEAIHPFVDGNGRVGRLFVNYCLSYWGHDPVIFYEKERETFFAAHATKLAMASFLRTKFVNLAR